MQYRRDEQRDALQVKVTNEGPEPVLVSRVGLSTPTFRAAVEQDKDSVIAPGLSVDLTLPLGEPDCDASLAAEATVTLDVDGRAVQLPVVTDVLSRINVRRCQVESVNEVVSLSLAPDWTATEFQGRPSVTGRLLIAAGARPETTTVTVDGATTLFTVAEPQRADVPVGAGPLTLPVHLVMTRCDAHAVAEDKKGYLLPVDVAVAGRPAIRVEVPVPVPDREPLQALVDRTC